MTWGLEVCVWLCFVLICVEDVLYWCIQVDLFDHLTAYLFKDEDLILIMKGKNQLFVLLNKFHSAVTNHCVMSLRRQ